MSIAFDDLSLEPDPTWTDVTALASSLVASYDIDRGREDEFLGTDTGTARVWINDQDGILDPTNAAGPYYGLIEPLRQILIELLNPVTDEWEERFRGFIEDYDYVPDPSTHVNADGEYLGNMALEISCADLTAILVAIEMQPDGSFGNDPADATPPATGNIWFEPKAANERIEQVLGNAGIDPFWFVVFTLNVNLQDTSYSPSQSVMEVIDEAVDAEFPTVSNRYVDRHGRLAVHGRLAKFDPDGTAADAGAAQWDFHHWKAGDSTAVAASISDTAQIRELGFNRGLGKIYNTAFCTPKGFDPEVDDIADQTFKDTGSIATYGYRSWSSESLIIDSGILTGNDRNAECLLFATFIVTNYKTARNRITNLVVMSLDPIDPRAAATWELLSKIDIADMIDVTLHDPGATNTGGFNAEPFFVEGVHETASPASGRYAMVRTTLSVSPAAYFSDPVGLDG